MKFAPNVEKTLREAQVAIAAWTDYSDPDAVDGICWITIKGERVLRCIVESETEQMASVATVYCGSMEEARFLRAAYGDGAPYMQN